MAVGFLFVATVLPVPRRFVRWCGLVLAVEAAVGILGTWLHARSVAHGPAPGLEHNILYGAPVFAPLLFADLAALAALGLWDLWHALPPDPEATLEARAEERGMAVP